MKHDIDPEYLNRVVNILGNLILSLADAKYSDKEEKNTHIYFIRSVLINLLGNLIINMSDPKIENSGQKNIDETIEDIKSWFETVKKHHELNKKESH